MCVLLCKRSHRQTCRGLPAFQSWEGRLEIQPRVTICLVLTVGSRSSSRSSFAIYRYLSESFFNGALVAAQSLSAAGLLQHSPELLTYWKDGSVRGRIWEKQASVKVNTRNAKKHRTRDQLLRHFPQNGCCVLVRRRAVEQQASRMVLLCAACLRSVAELMDMTQERAWNQFSASKKCL